ncbi:MAG TPA: hypothetical protein VM580_10240 [Labilithrix sp.]|nr:hypothetical protein [Labilithrix sp.]
MPFFAIFECARSSNARVLEGKRVGVRRNDFVRIAITVTGEVIDADVHGFAQPEVGVGEASYDG